MHGVDRRWTPSLDTKSPQLTSALPHCQPSTLPAPVSAALLATQSTHNVLKRQSRRRLDHPRLILEALAVVLSFSLGGVLTTWILGDGDHMRLKNPCSTDSATRTRSRDGIQGSPPHIHPATLQTRVLAENAWLRLESHDLKSPKKDGEVIRDWWWVRLPDHINVVPHISRDVARALWHTDAQKRHTGMKDLRLSARATAVLDSHQQQVEEDVPLFILLRQSKYAFSGGRTSWAVVGGLVNESLDGTKQGKLQQTARRELLEELGLASDDWLPFGTFAVDANRGCGTVGVFLALNARVDIQASEAANLALGTGDVNDTGDLEERTAYIVTLDDLHDIVTHPDEVLELKWSYTLSRVWIYFNYLNRAS